MQPQSNTSPLETWKPVVGYEGLYEVSDLGRVRRIAPANATYVGRILKPSLSQGGYVRVSLHDHGQTRYIFIHRLVARAFLGLPLPGQEVNHINGVKPDNRVVNLEWVTSSRNTLHAYVAGLAPTGECRSDAKLTEADVRAIRTAMGSVAQKELARQFGVSQRTIGNVQHGRLWKHVPP